MRRNINEQFDRLFHVWRFKQPIYVWILAAEHSGVKFNRDIKIAIWFCVTFDAAAIQPNAIN